MKFTASRGRIAGDPIGLFTSRLYKDTPEKVNRSRPIGKVKISATTPPADPRDRKLWLGWTGCQSSRERFVAGFVGSSQPLFMGGF